MDRRLRRIATYMRSISIYVAIALSILAMLSMAYGKTIEAMRVRLVENTWLHIEHGVAVLQEQLVNTYIGLMDLAGEPYTKSLTKMRDLEARDYYKLMVLREKALDMNLTGGIVDDYYLFINERLVVTSTRVHDDYLSSCAHQLIDTNDMRAERFLAMVMGDQVGASLGVGQFFDMNDLYTSKDGRAQRIPFVFAPSCLHPMLRGVVMINAQELARMLLAEVAEAELCIYAQDRRLMPGALQGSPPDDGVLVQGGKTIFTMTPSIGGITLSIAIPDRYIKEQLDSYRTLQIAFIMISAFLCATLIGLLFWSVVRPLARITNVSGGLSLSGLIRRIESMLSVLEGRNKHLSRQIDTLMPSVRQNTLNQLLTGVGDYKTWLHQLPKIHDMVTMPYRLALVQRMDHTAPEELSTTLCAGLTSTLIEPLCARNSLFVIFYPGDQCLMGMSGIWMGGISGEHTGGDTIRQAYTEARRALAAARIGDGGVALYDDVQRLTPLYSVPYWRMERLRTLIKGMCADEALSELHSLIEQVQEGSDEHTLLYDELRLLFARISCELGVNIGALPEWGDGTTKAAMLSGCEASILNVCDVIKSQPEQEDTAVVDFVRENYTRQDMSLKLIGAEFHLSEKYVSQYFKDRVGCLFSEYLETLRLQHSLELLAAEDLPSADIALAVGYANYDTFYRSFKRKYCVAPGAWRALHRT